MDPRTLAVLRTMTPRELALSVLWALWYAAVELRWRSR
jgi:hypothetical protein